MIAIQHMGKSFHYASFFLLFVIKLIIPSYDKPKYVNPKTNFFFLLLPVAPSLSDFQGYYLLYVYALMFVI